MKTVDVDVAILGAGTAGLVARRAAEKQGARAVMIDPGPHGTTCARVGCMPSKLLIAAADAAHHARHADAFGVHTSGVQIDGEAVMERVRRERDRFVSFVMRSIDSHRKQDQLIEGRGRFVDEHCIEVEGHTRVSFRSAVIATGTSPFVPPPFRELGDALVFNDQVFSWTDLPGSVLVVGTGVIGLELGQALHRLGVRTTLVGIRNVVGPLSDPEVRSHALRTLGEELDLHADYHLESVEALPEGGVRVRFDGREECYDKVLIAAGRRANLGELGLDALGLEPSEVEADPHTGQIGSSHLFLAGDASSFRPLLHEAADEGRIAGRNAASWPEVHAVPRRAPLGIVFCDPQIAMVGLRHDQLEDSHRIGSVDYGDQGRARVMNRHQGLVRIYGARACGTIVGAEMFGPGVEHSAHLLAWAVQQRTTVDQALGLPFYHPVLEEGIRTALRDLQHNLRFEDSAQPCPELEDSM